MKDKMIAPCGTKCATCKDYPYNCRGCCPLKGKVYWTEYVGVEICPLYDCPINQHEYTTCAECENIPCQKWFDLKDPAVTDEAFEKEIQERLNTLKEFQ